MTPPTLHAQIVIACSQFDATLAALTDQLGFRIALIFPADAPTTAVISGHGVTLRLESASVTLVGRPIVLRLETDQRQPDVTVPDLSIEWALNASALAVTEGRQAFHVARMGDNEAWRTGRAGMQYRDLIPGRYGGRFIASHIRIPDGGPVPDYVHFHRVRFQMIFCKSGWVKVVYEDQGEPFRMEAGDCVLQPPQIRHRVLEASAGLEVIELGCPAIHLTEADYSLALPTPTMRPTREFAGQRFARHVAAGARWIPWTWQGRGTTGFDMRNTGIDTASAALASVCVVRVNSDLSPGEGATAPVASHEGELCFLFVLSGALHLSSESLGEHILNTNDCVTIPAGALVSLQAQPQTEFLQVALPAI